MDEKIKSYAIGLFGIVIALNLLVGFIEQHWDTISTIIAIGVGLYIVVRVLRALKASKGW